MHGSMFPPLMSHFVNLYLTNGITVSQYSESTLHRPTLVVAMSDKLLGCQEQLLLK